MCALVSGADGGAPLQQQGVADVAHAHGFGVGGQGQLVAGAAVAVDVPTVAAVVLCGEQRQGQDNESRLPMQQNTLTQSHFKRL